MKITNEDIEIALGINSSESWMAEGLSIDSRTANSKNLFIAIKGENFDGHDFVQEAANKGVISAIVSEEIKIGIPIIVVKDTLKAMQDLANYKRTQSSAKMIAVTGSVGKTTTKDMIYQVLSSYGKAYSNHGNLNNHIGLPLSLLNAPDDAEYIILEMGMNSPGEIAILTNIMKPDISIITKIDSVHLEFFSSVEAIAKAKAEIFIGTKSVAILNKDDKYYDYLYSIVKKYPSINRIITVGKDENSDVKLVSYNSKYVSVLINNSQEVRYEFPTIYKHFVMNSLFPIATLNALTLEVNESVQHLSNFNLQKGRGNIYRVNGIVVIDDTYNANPPSVKAALNLLSQFKGRKIVILSDMLELGEKSKEFHIELVNPIMECKIDVVLSVGTNMKFLYDNLKPDIKKVHFNRLSDCDVLSYIQKGDNILVKGSRGTKMELIVEQLLLYDK